MAFKLNDQVRLKEDINKKGTVIDNISKDIYEILWDSGDIESLRTEEIEHNVINKNPWDKLGDNEFDDFKNFTISSILNKVQNSSSNTISTLKASKTIFKPYQFIPLLKLLNSESKRIIVADEVGLGKTISAGHIILELAARGELNSLLIICLNSIQSKWIDELQNKFNIRVNQIESIKAFKTQIENSQKHNDKIFSIINYDKFRSIENIDYFKTHAIKFDLIILDEVHTLRNDTNARKSIKPFTELANALVFLTATPIMTNLENLYNLVKLLDYEKFSNYQIFENAINLNKPFIKAYNELNSGRRTMEIAEELLQTEIKNIFKLGEYINISNYRLEEILKNDLLFKNLIETLKSKDNITAKEKVLIQEQLINLNSLNHFYTRTRKIDVQTDGTVVKRNSKVIYIEMNNEEEYIYDKIINQFDENDLGTIQVKRKFASSLFADQFTEEEYLNGGVVIKVDDNKYTALKEVINQQKKNQLIVFAFFRKTLLYLKNRLESDGLKVGIIYGGIELSERNKIIEKFKENEFQILLSSEVGSTGLDMQFCSRLVNYDLPWNPMVIEQRIGRIDRIGQNSEVINIFSFAYKGTIEELICNRLYDRISLFKEALGNLDEILGNKENYIEGEIEKIYKQKLTKEETIERLERIATAIERNKYDIKKIDEGLKDSFSNDLYFENEIKFIEHNKQYLTDKDLEEFINRIIGNKLTTLTITKTHSKEDIFVIKQPDENTIFNFIEKYYDNSNSELNKIYQTFRTKNRNKTIICTFNQNTAFNNKNIEYISAYHPFINAISNYFQIEKLDRNTIFKFGINRKNVLSKDFNQTYTRNYYFLIKFEFEICKTINGQLKKFLILKSIVIDLSGDQFEIMPDNQFSSTCQEFKTAIPEDGAIQFNPLLMEEIKKIYSNYIVEEKYNLEKNEKMKFNSDLSRKVNQEVSDIQKRIQRLEYNIANRIGIEAVQKSEIEALKLKEIESYEILSNSKILISSKLISLNYVYVYG